MSSLVNAKNDFPLFSERKDAFHYLDSASTTQKPQAVILAVAEAYKRFCANPHRGAYRLSEDVTAKVASCRESLRRFFNVPDSHEVIFTHGATDALNALVFMMTPFLEAGDNVIVSPLEHHANLLPWYRQQKNIGTLVSTISTEDKFEVTLSDIERSITPSTKIISVTHVSNVLGTILPIKEITQIAKEKNIRVFVDGSQAAANLPVSIKNLGCDAYIVSAHKMYGPSGVGALIIDKALAETFEPYQLGGGMVLDVKDGEMIFAPLPERLEAGTLPIEGIIGWQAAIEYLSSFKKEEKEKHLRNLRSKAWEALSKIKGLTLFGSKDGIGAFSFAVEGVHSHDMATILDGNSVCVRAGHHCAKPLMGILGIESLARVSFGIYNDESDIEALVKGIVQAQRILL